MKYYTYGKKILSVDKNPHFKGVTKLDLVTGLPKITYPSCRRIGYYIVSALEAIPIIALAIFLKLIIFNIQGLFSSTHSLFYIGFFAQLNQPGGLLYNVPGIATILNILTVTVIL